MKVLLIAVLMMGAPVWADVLGCGAVIRTSVALENDMVCSGTALYVGAHHVTVDLNGHTIRWVAPSWADEEKILFRGYGVRNDGVLPDPDNPGGQRFVGGGYDNVKIVNGTIEGFNVGVYLATTTGNTLRELWISRQHRRRVTTGYIDGVAIVASLANDHLTIENNTIENNDRGGIAMDGLLCNQPTDPKVNGSVLYVCAANAIRSNVIRDNNEEREGAEIYGIQLLEAAGTQVTGNIVGGHTRSATSLYNAAGIVIVSSKDNEIANNELKEGEVGLLIADLAYKPSTNLSISNNIAQNNIRNGFEFRIEAPATINAITTRLEGNRAERNGGSGFVYDSGKQEPALGAIQLGANEATRNAAYGVYVPGAFDLGRNRSTENRIDDCVGVVCQQ